MARKVMAYSFEIDSPDNNHLFTWFALDRTLLDELAERLEISHSDRDSYMSNSELLFTSDNGGEYYRNQDLVPLLINHEMVRAAELISRLTMENLHFLAKTLIQKLIPGTLPLSDEEGATIDPRKLLMDLLS